MPNKLYFSDNKEIIKQMPDNSVNLILTDPPYIISKDSNFNRTDEYKYKNYSMDYGEWDKIDLDWQWYFENFFRILKDGGQVIIFYDIFKVSEIKKIAESCGFKQPRVGIWVKNNPVPINSSRNYLSNAKEFFLTFTKKGKPTFNSKYDNGIYEFPTIAGTSKENVNHPTQKPLSLINELVKKHSNIDDIIFDPFCGSGTTLVSAKILGRQWIGIDNNQDYIDICNTRLKD